MYSIRIPNRTNVINAKESQTVSYENLQKKVARYFPRMHNQTVWTHPLFPLLNRIILRI